MEAGGKAIILLGHGSRDPLWRRPIEAVAQRLTRGHPGLAVCCAYLELQPPDLAAAAAQLAAAGARRVTIVPMFLGTGKHGRDDPPRLLESLRQAHPAIYFDLRAPVGEDPRVLDLIATIALE
ncbi:MAG TPA: CbiX/SirB N-terminal domain-containing protein [Ramlibacter sp.]|nr:CbiX/SirB N-terminal domain-containing protein [Ramlibacter sp.]